jgi:hypothetical protein
MMNRRSPSDRALERWAKLGITGQFLALLRTLGEYFRLRYLHGPALSLPFVDPFIGAALMTAFLCWLAVLLYFAGRYRATLVVAGATVVALLAWKIFLIPPAG